MKYPNWDKYSDSRKVSVVKEEMRLATHNGTTKDDLLNMVRWLWRREIRRALEVDDVITDGLTAHYGKGEVEAVWKEMRKEWGYED